ncbi:MAG TPA: glycosyltransferase [Thermoanaerobaculia bacterium]|nr:glycosyltransferase [Thermoanaerobaculia bacterium]
MSEKLRVARVIARLNVGGPARHVAWLTAALNDEQFESLLITGSLPAGEDDMSSFARERGVEPLVIEAMSRAISPKDIFVIAKLFRIFRRFRPDVVHTHTAKAGTVGRIAALLYRFTTRRRVRLVHTFHGHVFHGYYGRLATRVFITIERLLARITDTIVVISRRQLEEIHGTYRLGRREQFAVIPLGLDLAIPDAHADLREELGLPRDAFVAGIVGRLTEIKDHRLFLEGVAASRDAGATFVIIGGGHLREPLESYAKELGADARFLGNRDDPEVFYSALDALVLTSKNEGTPLTIIEAMSHAIPVIATPVGGVPDLLGDPLRDLGDGATLCERGITIERTPRAFAAAIRQLKSDASLRAELGARGRTFVESEYTVARLVRDIRALYLRLTSAS